MEPLYRAADIEDFARLAVIRLGAPDATAAHVARHLAGANLAGHDSHGVLRLPQYARQIDAGEIVPAAQPEVLRDAGAALLIDAHRGFGHYSTLFALDRALDRAAQTGIACASIRHSTHVGRLGEYTETAAARGFAAIVTAGAAGPGVGGMMAYGGRDRFLAANPWSIGIPAGEAAPFIFDASMSTTAEGKLRMALARGETVPPDCIIDRDGNPSRNPADFYAGGALVPLGGASAGHKGFGLALAAALLGGLSMIGDPEPTMIGVSVKDDRASASGRVAGVFLAVIDPSAFGPAAGFTALVAAHFDAGRSLTAAPGQEVLIPGEPERRTRERRTREGIPIPEATRADLETLAVRLGIAMPAAIG